MRKQNYLNKFSLKGKIAIVVGGYGLIGFEITKALSDAGAKVVILDQKKLKNSKIKRTFFIKFDCKSYETFNKKLISIKKKIGLPEIYINASYPATKDWPSNTFEKINVNLDEQIKMYMTKDSLNQSQIEDYMRLIKLKDEMIKVVAPKWYENRYLWFFMGIAITVTAVDLAGQLD